MLLLEKPMEGCRETYSTRQNMGNGFPGALRSTMPAPVDVIGPETRAFADSQHFATESNHKATHVTIQTW
jgi:hypothetical protein